MDSFHIRHKWPLVWENVSCITIFDLDLYLQCDSTMTAIKLLKYVTSCLSAPQLIQLWMNSFPIISVAFWHSETCQICNFRAFSWERMRGMPWNLECWHVLTTFKTYEILVTVHWFSSFGCHFDFETSQIVGIFFGTQGRKGLKFDIWVDPDHIWKW